MRANIYKRHSNARATETPAVVSRDKSDRDEATETHEGHENDDLDFNPCDLNPQGRSRFDVVRLSDNRSLLQDVQCDRARRQQDMTEFRFATWNIGSMTGKDGEMVEILKKRKIQLCCMQETKWKGKNQKTLGEYKFYWKGQDESNGGGKGRKKTVAEAGVGIMLNRTLVENVIDVIGISERLMIMKLQIGGRILNVFSAYAPQTGRTKDVKDTFWNELYEEIRKIPKDDMICLEVI